MFCPPLVLPFLSHLRAEVVYHARVGARDQRDAIDPACCNCPLRKIRENALSYFIELHP